MLLMSRLRALQATIDFATNCQCVLTLTQNGYGGGGGGGGAWWEASVEEGKREEEASALRTLRAPVPRQEGALGTTITGKDGDDPQPVNRVIQACGTHCHYCYVWI